MRTMLTSLLAFALVVPLAGHAQTPLSLHANTRIRYTLAPPGTPTVATVVALRSDTLWARRIRPPGTAVVPLSILARLDTSGGRHTHVLKSAAVGLLIGAATGAILGAATSGGCGSESWVCPSKGLWTLFVASDLGVVGAGIGAVVGFIHRTERWLPVRLPGSRAP